MSSRYPSIIVGVIDPHFFAEFFKITFFFVEPISDAKPAWESVPFLKDKVR
jgi:hypothetical protein